MGTGRFFEKLKPHVGPIEPFGIDISEKMIEIARLRIPALEAAVDDAANLDSHFLGTAFDLVCTHFVTGFVPMSLLAGKIHERLAPGGYWSLVGGAKAGFPALQKKARAPGVKWLFGGRTLQVDDMVCNPANQKEVTTTLESYGFTIRACETFTPPLYFKDFNAFMEFAYYGGWLTPFIEILGLHKAPRLARTILNTFFFPIQDHHSIVIALAQKTAR
jgi:SAM-dependent methyltransferase